LTSAQARRSSDDFASTLDCTRPRRAAAPIERRDHTPKVIAILLGVCRDIDAHQDLSGAEDRAFWTWAAVETLCHTGIRITELTELSTTGLIEYTLPNSGECVRLLQITPSETDTERLLGISP
jgi:hypothetical protein